MAICVARGTRDSRIGPWNARRAHGGTSRRVGAFWADGAGGWIGCQQSVEVPCDTLVVAGGVVVVGVGRVCWYGIRARRESSAGRP